MTLKRSALVSRPSASAARPSLLDRRSAHRTRRVDDVDDVARLPPVGVRVARRQDHQQRVGCAVERLRERGRGRRAADGGPPGDDEVAIHRHARRDGLEEVAVAVAVDAHVVAARADLGQR
jgi:hypothetical protein